MPGLETFSSSLKMQFSILQQLSKAWVVSVAVDVAVDVGEGRAATTMPRFQLLLQRRRKVLRVHGQAARHHRPIPRHVRRPLVPAAAAAATATAAVRQSPPPLPLRFRTPWPLGPGPVLKLPLPLPRVSHSHRAAEQALLDDLRPARAFGRAAGSRRYSKTMHTMVGKPPAVWPSTPKTGCSSDPCCAAGHWVLRVPLTEIMQPARCGS